MTRTSSRWRTCVARVIRHGRGHYTPAPNGVLAVAGVEAIRLQAGAPRRQGRAVRHHQHPAVAAAQ